MRKRSYTKLNLASETLHHLDGLEVQKARGGIFQKCADNSSGRFSGMPISYCDTISGNSACP
jgi:hypothetical protein